MKLDINFIGNSRDEYIEAKVLGFKPGFVVDLYLLQKFVSRRSSVDEVWSTPRKEKDTVILKSGFNEIDKNHYEINSEEIVIRVYNTDIKKEDSSSYYICRPSHADFVSYLKYGEVYPGGGPFSGRMTVLYAAVGGIAIQILSKFDIDICAYISSINGTKSISYQDENFQLMSIKQSTLSFRTDAQKIDILKDVIKDAATKGDSVGGFIECIVSDIKPCIGGLYFNSLESIISKNLFAIPGIKSVEFGDGVDFAKYPSSILNDSYILKEDGMPKTYTNHAGGINGGFTNGQPLLLRVSVKGIPSISIPQNLLCIDNEGRYFIKKDKIIGRHDICILPRAVVLVEAGVGISLLEAIDE